MRKEQYLLITYYKEYNVYHILYNHGKDTTVRNSKSLMLRKVLNGQTPQWRATILWCDNSQNEITMMYKLERR